MTDGREQGVAAGDGADACDQLLRRDVLEQEAARAGPQRLVDVLVHVEGRQHHDLGGRVRCGQQLPRRLDPVDLGHAHVHQDDIRRDAARLLDRLSPVRRLADDLEVGLGLEDHPEAGAHERLVVDDQHAHRSARVRRPLEDALVLAVGEVRRTLARLRPQRREVRREPVDRELVDAHRPVEVLQQVRPEIVDRDALELGLLVVEQRPRRLGDQDLSAVPRVADPSRPVDGEPDVLVADRCRLARVHTDPDAQIDALGPGVRGQGVLRRDCGLDRLAGPAESDEERVAVGVELATARLAPGAAEQALVVADHGLVAVAQAADERRRALHVAEQEGDGGGLVRAHVQGVSHEGSGASS